MSKTAEGRFTKVHGCTNSTDALAGLKAASSALSIYKTALADGEERAKVLAKMDEKTRKLFATDHTVEAAQDHARIVAHDFVRSIQLGVMRSINRFDADKFYEADTTKLSAMIEHAEKLYKTFPDAFPIPSGEKSA